MFRPLALALITLLAGSTSGHRRNSRKVVESYENVFPRYSKKCKGCLLLGDRCYRESCKQYCTFMRSEPCEPAYGKAYCFANPWDLENGLCKCHGGDGCPGRYLHGSERWAKACTGKCRADEYCIHNGGFYDSSQIPHGNIPNFSIPNSEVYGLPEGWGKEGATACAPCRLVLVRLNPGEYPIERCAKCEGNLQGECIAYTGN